MKNAFLPLVLSLWLVCVYTPIQAQTTVILSAAADNTLFEDANGSLSNGAGPGLFVGVTNQEMIRRAVIRFSLSGSVPADATITEVSLSMNMDMTIAGNTPVTLHKVTAAWGEGTSDAGIPGGGGALAATGDATWIHTFFSSAFWTNAGGDFVSSASASTIVGGTGSYSWTSTGMIDDVEDWLADSTTNHGWILIGDESTFPTAKRFGSRENTGPGMQPLLSITYTVPCIEPDIPTLSAGSMSICLGDNTSVVATGNLNDATDWFLYEGSCGGNLISSNSTGIFSVSPVVTSTYYVRGEGGCTSPGDCAQITIVVNEPDDATFNYLQTAYCQNESAVLPSISGVSGGVFSVSPAGLDLNAVTGLIDPASSLPGSYTVTYTTPGIICEGSSSEMIQILPSYSVQVEAFFCVGDTFTFGSNQYTEEGIYVETFISSQGCDSIVELTLSYTSLQEEPEITSVSAGSVVLCAGESTTITISGSLNDATAWHLYTDGCGLTPAASNSTGLFEVSPSATITYFVRGENPCAPPGGCEEITITVLPMDDAGFNYPATALCQNESPQTPVITGTPGGEFEAIPAGLQLNTTTGVIDPAESTPGTYTVLYTTPGPDCPVVSEVTITLFQSYDQEANAEICSGDEYVFGSQTLTESGTYIEVFTSAQGCDSLVTLNLSVITFDIDVDQDNEVLIAVQGFVNYQWVDCDNGFEPIVNETDHIFTASQNGNYAVILSFGDCSAISDCYEVTTVSVSDPGNDHREWISLSPNPVSGYLRVNSVNHAQVRIFDVTGRLVHEQTIIPGTVFVETGKLSNGFYLLKAESAQGASIIPFIVQH